MVFDEICLWPVSNPLYYVARTVRVKHRHRRAGSTTEDMEGNSRIVGER